MRKKLFTFLLAMVASISPIFAESGTCGDNLTWDLTYGILTISGTGAMANYTLSIGNAPCPWYSSRSSIQSVIISDGCTSIGDYAFYDCSGLTSVTIPNSVISIGNGAFDDCSNLPVIDNLRYADTYLVETVDKSLSTYNIKQGTKWIGDYAFRSCSSLTSVTIPNSVTSIREYAFVYCSGLTSVTIPNSVTNIGSCAFYECCSLTAITCEAVNPPALGDYVFDDVDKSIPLYVPAESVDAYKAADQWREFTNIRAIDEEQGIEDVQGDNVQGTKAHKILRNGQIFILRGEKVYTITTGQKMK